MLGMRRFSLSSDMITHEYWMKSGFHPPVLMGCCVMESESSEKRVHSILNTGRQHDNNEEQHDCDEDLGSNTDKTKIFKTFFLSSTEHRNVVLTILAFHRSETSNWMCQIHFQFQFNSSVTISRSPSARHSRRRLERARSSCRSK